MRPGVEVEGPPAAASLPLEFPVVERYKTPRMPEKPRFLLSLVIPCFNEAEVMRLTHGRVLQALGNQPDFDLEIVYVNDGSVDETEAILFELANQDRRVRVVSFTRNFGHQPAVTAGLTYATGDAVAVLDADLQDPPEVVLDMIAKWRDGYDAVYGVRTKRKEGLLKRISYKTFYRLYSMLASIDVQVDSGDFALMDRRVVDALNSLPEKNRFVRGLRAWVGFSQTACVYERAERVAGEPKYPLRQLVKLALDGIFNFSMAPLNFIFVLGVCTATATILAACIYLVGYIGGFTIFGRAPKDVPGFTTLILTLLFFSGVQLMSVGILGEYLGRIYQETKMRPTYLVKEVRGGRTADVSGPVSETAHGRRSGGEPAVA
jgi:glycosyltransferase involved in cell wall biosynthesis